MPPPTTEWITSFLAKARKEELPPPFLGPLAALVSSDVASSWLTMYLLRPESLTEFDGHSVDGIDDIVGLAYVVATNRTKVHFWFHPKTCRDVANPSILALLHRVRAQQPAVLRLPGLESSYCTYIDANVRGGVQWKPTNGYELHVLDPAVVVKATALGSSWTVDGETFEMDVADPGDIAPILSLASVGKLARVVRVASTKQPVSWSLVHSDFSIGLLGTIPEYRRKGFAALALGSTIAAYRTLAAANESRWFGVQPHCFVLSSNIASQHVMATAGFKTVPNKTFHWMRLNHE
ncbi:hypothetical protein H310_07267 [Aphanomyces invadans]|uniref:N-acetyltransferase domain-containing protein n=1 Tax=Aphanomyces invadans TaxID=157072 RepID=A0A024U3A3_9STRA|nr:hypothetical protein H310_07267 [Aphanomyces invadans]ETW00710.1 hypothetical protein H310_07267 [Aphanomyces invadans]|eukprot:XP_008870845.1 hypothetical protein H310_07267 [Aphanomyces invadans]